MNVSYKKDLAMEDKFVIVVHNFLNGNKKDAVKGMNAISNDDLYYFIDYAEKNMGRRETLNLVRSYFFFQDKLERIEQWN